jgi:TPR repeat protein
VERIGPYEVVDELGRGGMGVVYRARDSRSGDEVALKLLLSHRGANEHARQRTATELAVLIRLRHPSVVAALGSGEHQGAPYLALELVDGESLQSRLRRGPLPIQEAIRIGRELAGALAHVHAQGALHRDLKPDNVLLRSSDGAALLTDFGLALDLEASYSRVSRTGVFLGTPGYWAPEQARGEIHELSPSTDVYGLGAVLYAALTANPPVTGTSLVEFLEPIRFERIVPPQRVRAEVPGWLSELCMSCLSPDPNARPVSAALVEEALAEPRVDKRQSWASVLAIALLAGLVSALASVGLTSYLGESSPSPAPSPSAEAVEAVPSPPSTPAESSPRDLARRGLEALEAKNYDEARALLLRAVERGNRRAMVGLGQLFSSAPTDFRDDAQAAEWYRRAAEKGSVPGMVGLGQALRVGRGVPKDEAQAAKWYQRAADQGNSRAMVKLGVMLARGQGVPKDLGRAVELYRQAVAKNNTMAMFNLGQVLHRGRGAPKDVAGAVGLYRRAIEGGNTHAMVSLGVMLERGIDIPRDDPAAAGLYRRAAERGNTKGMAALGVMLETGIGVPRDVAQAMVWYRRAAERGNSLAMVNLANRLAAGIGGSKDEGQAVEWFRRAAKRGNARAMFNLGNMLRLGRGVPQDEAGAVEWYRLAANKGDAEAMFNLGVTLTAGTGVPKDAARARHWFRLAAKKGDVRIRQAAEAALQRAAR